MAETVPDAGGGRGADLPRAALDAIAGPRACEASRRRPVGQGASVVATVAAKPRALAPARHGLVPVLATGLARVVPVAGATGRRLIRAALPAPTPRLMGLAAQAWPVVRVGPTSAGVPTPTA